MHIHIHIHTFTSSCPRVRRAHRLSPSEHTDGVHRIAVHSLGSNMIDDDAKQQLTKAAHEGLALSL